MNIPAGWDIVVKGSPSSVDEGEFYRSLRILLDPEATHALHCPPHWRVFPVKAGEIIPPADLDDLTRGTAVYFTLNPLTQDYLSRWNAAPERKKPSFNNTDISHRRWMLIDSDFKRPAGTSTTSDEKEESLTLLSAVIDDMSDRGFPAPIVADSGNGYHAFYRIDLPNDPLSRSIIGGCLKALAKKHDTDRVMVDTSVCDAKRICKVPGTMVRKGEPTAERPHRMSSMLWVPETIEVVPADLLSSLASNGNEEVIYAGKVTTPPKFDPWEVKVKTPETNAYARSALEREIGRVAISTSSRNVTLNKAAFALGGFVGEGLLTEDEVRGKLTQAAKACGLGSDGDPHEIDRTISNGLDAGKKDPRKVPEKPPASRQSVPAGLPDRLLVFASEITPKRVEWLWPDRVPIGKLTTFAGWGGLGKSFVTMDLAARVSVGGEIPGGKGECFKQGKVLLLNSEDDPDDTSVPRLIEAGADLRQIAFAKPETLGKVTLGDLDLLDRMLDQIPGVTFVVIDPVTAHLGDVNDHKNAELKALLAPLSLWSAERRIALVLVTHVNKPGAGKVEAMARVVGGVAWVNTVRSAIMFCADPNDPIREKRLFIPFKTNNGPPTKGFAYRVVPTGNLARVEWLEETDLSADEACNQKPVRTGELTYDETLLWLMNQFQSCVKVASSVIWDRAKQESVSSRQLKQAKIDLCIKAKQMECDSGGSAWFWVAPSAWPDPGEQKNEQKNGSQ